MNATSLSVIIPVWNGERYLAEAITSVLAQEPVLEVIVVDDGSDDESASVADGFGPPVRCVRVAHGGLAAARNAGVEVATGDYLLHLDSDDVLPPRSIASRMTEFRRSQTVDLVVGQTLSFISPDLDPATASRFQIPDSPYRGGLPGASVLRAPFARKVGGFDTRRDHSPDLDWMARAVTLGVHIVELPTVVLHRRIHGRNMSLTQRHLENERLAILRAARDRRRTAGD